MMPLPLHFSDGCGWNKLWWGTKPLWHWWRQRFIERFSWKDPKDHNYKWQQCSCFWGERFMFSLPPGFLWWYNFSFSLFTSKCYFFVRILILLGEKIDKWLFLFFFFSPSNLFYISRIIFLVNTRVYLLEVLIMLSMDRYRGGRWRALAFKLANIKLVVFIVIIIMVKVIEHMI